MSLNDWSAGYKALAVVCFALVAAPLVWLVWKLFDRLAFTCSGWAALADAFPDAAFTPATGETYRTGAYLFNGRTSYNAMRTTSFQVELGSVGLRITPAFAKELPIVVPWARLLEIEGSEQVHLLDPHYVTVTLDYKNSVRFYLPHAAFAALKAHVPAELMHQYPSLLQVIRERSSL